MPFHMSFELLRKIIQQPFAVLAIVNICDCGFFVYNVNVFSVD